MLLGAPVRPAFCQDQPGEKHWGSGSIAVTSTATSALFDRVIANQKRMEVVMETYERTQTVQIRKTGSETTPSETKVWRLFPGGPAVTKLPQTIDNKPVSTEVQRADLEKLEHYLEWAIQKGAAQQDAYARAERKRKDRHELIESTHAAFVFKREGEEKRGDRMLAKYSMEPNPHFKPKTRNEVVFTKVRGTLWIDEQASELARIEGSVTEDISIALFLAKVYKGSQFMQERYELAPGLWFPTYEQYDFDGRKFMLSFAIHERTSYSNYKRVGPPEQALEVVRGELSKKGEERKKE